MGRRSRSAFSRRLRDLRLERRLRQTDVAAQIGVAQTTIANYEQGIRFPDGDTLARIADLFEVSIDWLFGRVSEPAAPHSGERTTIDRRPSEQDVEYIDIYLGALFSGDGEAALEVVGKLESLGWGAREIYSRVFAPALRECGMRWMRGVADIAQEHFTTYMTGVFMAQLLSRTPAQERKPFSLAAVSVPGDLHDMGVRMVSDFLQLEGWTTRYLGMDLPTESVVGAVARIKPSVLAISATIPHGRETVAALIAALRRTAAVAGTKLMVGGRAFDDDPTMWRRVGADGWALSAEEAVVCAKRLAGDLGS